MVTEKNWTREKKKVKVSAHTSVNLWGHRLRISRKVGVGWGEEVTNTAITIILITILLKYHQFSGGFRLHLATRNPVNRSSTSV